VGILADLAGPKVRLGDVTTDSLELVEGTVFVLASGSGNGNGDPRADTNHPGLAGDLRTGDRLLIADGTVELSVIECGEEIVTRVVRGGVVRSRAGLTVPSERLSLPALSEKDRFDLARALELGAGAVAQSFVRGGADVRQLRELIGARPVAVFAKIETRAGIEQADGILEEADGIIVGRGDLGSEMPVEEIPHLQKYLILRARAAGKPAIVATEMLQSMTASWRPTRAEASDVANAVLDGAEGILLSAETAIGRYPVEAASAAVRIIEEAERVVGPRTSRMAPWAPGTTNGTTRETVERRYQ
jgi:pyruvate kinase